MPDSGRVEDLRDFCDRLSGEATLIGDAVTDDQSIGESLIQWQSMLNTALHELELVILKSRREQDPEKQAHLEEAIATRLDTIFEDFDFDSIRVVLDKMADSFIHRATELKRLTNSSILQGSE